MKQEISKHGKGENGKDKYEKRNDKTNDYKYLVTFKKNY